MKKQLTKVLVLSLLVAGAASCGKDNEKSSATTNTTTTTTSNPVTSVVGEGTCASAQNLDQLKAIYNNWSTSNYTLPKQKYTYEEYTMGEYELKEKSAWIFDYTTLDFKDSFKRTTTKDSSTAQSEFGGSKEGIRLNTLAVLNRVSPFDIRIYSSSLIEVVDNNGDVYGFNLCAPIAANPVSVFDESENTLVKIDRIRGQ
ncbi:MAG: hypothetical protein GY909_05280 [Oligoflexia bacterium]|nr:hypothetical protein [Oligoflexia bacterium]